MATGSILPISQLPAHLKSFPQRWPFPKGDLYHWIPLFNRFDKTLDEFCVEYGLHEGPQVRPFQRALLLKGVEEESKAETVASTSASELDTMGYTQAGDKHLVEVILDFSRRLLENCGNRSLYNSSERLGDLLNTTDLSLLTTTLQLAVRLAQRYHASRQRGANASQHMNSALLASHYSIDLEKVQKLANPFVHSPSPGNVSIASPVSSSKGKEKVQPARSSNTTNANDLLALTEDTRISANGSVRHVSTSERRNHQKGDWKEWGSVLLTYYQPAVGPKEDLKPPTTPTPIRRSSGLSRPSRLSSSEGSQEPTAPTPVTPGTKLDDPATGGLRRLEIPYQRIASSSIEDVLKDCLENLPKDSQYELLTKLRNAYGVTSSLSSRQELVGIRLLAITNLAYIYPEAVFQQKILQQDSEEPRRLQLVYQLADLVHPPGNGSSKIPPKLQTLALGTLEAFAKQKTKASDVCAALNVNVNHGVLFYILHKAVAEMALEDSSDEKREVEGDEKQEALFSLLEALPASTPRTGETLVAAGLLDILVEVLNLRTKKAERAHPKVLTFLSTFLYGVRDAMQSLANCKGLDAISDLLNYEVNISLERAAKGEGLPPSFKTRSIDYQIPYFQQQSLRVVFKLISHMMTHGSANLDRLLRNLIDSPQLLNGLRTVIVNASTFGSAVWSGAINIMSVFIHNEPTSYSVISEAGLSKGLLETVSMESETKQPLKLFLEFVGDGNEISGPGLANANASTIANFMHDKTSRTARQAKITSVQGILPNSDAILGVPQAFSAICLNHSGMQLFLESGALDSFFKIFESDEHIKALSPNVPEREDLPRLLGSSFDELVRHHPNLKIPIMIAMMTMVERVGQLCKSQSKAKGSGAKLWLQGGTDELIPAGDKPLPGFDSVAVEDEDDVVMPDAVSINGRASSTPSVDPSELALRSKENAEDKSAATTATRIEVTTDFLAGFFENSTLCSFFVEAGGGDYVLDFATLPGLPYDFNPSSACHQLARVIHIMVEQKPHLILPSFLQRLQKTTDSLKPLYEYNGELGFFAEFTSPHTDLHPDHSVVPHASSIGTSIVKSLVNFHTLCNIFGEIFSSPIFGSRSGHTPFSQVNLADRYQELIKSLGLVHQVCVWEEIILQKELPEAWREATKMKGLGMGSDEADEVLGIASGDSDTLSTPGRRTNNFSMGSPGSGPQGTNGSPTASKGPSVNSAGKDEKSASFVNTKILRHLLAQIPSSVVSCYQNLGKALFPKRRPESYARQNAYMISEAISRSQLNQLRYELPNEEASVKDQYAYWIVALTSISSLLVDGK